MTDDRDGATAPGASILDLDDNVLLLIVDYLDGGQQRLVPFYQRRHLSVESFRNPLPPDRGSAQSLSGFRLACRRFADVAAKPQWVRVTTRFSEAGLRRLENIASSPRIARYVRKFCYMVPIFFDEGYDSIDALPEDLSRCLAKRISSRSAYQARIEERRRIIKDGMDARVLQTAFKAFTDLTHVQLCRLQDFEDGGFLRFLHKYPRALDHIRADWSSACHHSTKTISEALLTSQSACERFSSPALNVESAQFLAQRPPGKDLGYPDPLSQLTDRLKCLELHFVEPTNIDDRIRALTPSFDQVFRTATNLEALHVGFPEANPLSISLEDVFHHVKWKNLVAFGIQGWSLEAAEIAEFAGRHSTKLKGLRLRSVLLKDGSRWKDVLYYLKENLHLSWVSLRKIGYESHFLEKQSRMGVEWTDSDDDDEPDETEISDFSDDDEAGHVSEEAPHASHAPHESASAPLEHELVLEDTFELSSNDEDEHNEDPERFLHTMEFPRHLHDPVRRIRCNCREQMGGRHALSPAAAEALGDDGADPDDDTRKMWESWVVWMCPIHKSKLVPTAGSSASWES